MIRDLDIARSGWINVDAEGMPHVPGFDENFVHILEGHCPWCLTALEPVTYPPHEERSPMGGCRCCGFQFACGTHYYDELGESHFIQTTGWPQGVGEGKVGKCEHCITLGEDVIYGWATD